jgi:hypothetical protein
MMVHVHIIIIATTTSQAAGLRLPTAEVRFGSLF